MSEEIKYCGAKRRNGEPCKAVAGYGTGHVGDGRCKFHGGLNPIKSGRYSSVLKNAGRIKELVERFENDPDPLNLSPEVALLRAVVVDYMERYDVFTAALIAWHESFVVPGKEAFTKPARIVDFSEAASLADKVGAMVDRINKARKESGISIDTFNRVMEQMGVDLVNAAKGTVLNDDERAELIKAVERRWLSIRVDTGGNSSQRDS